MNNKKKSAFTLPETIMTLFIVGLVITAAIPAFTIKQNQIAKVKKSPWNTCATEGQTTMGMCGIKDDDDNDDDNDVAGKVVIGGGDAMATLTLNNGADESIYNIFQADERRIKIKDYIFAENTSSVSISPSEHKTAENSVIIGQIGNNTKPVNSVIIGNNTPTNAGIINNTVVIGNNNTVNNGNSIVFGWENTTAGTHSAIIGSKITGTKTQLLIGPSLTGDLDTNQSLNIGNIILGDTSGNTITFNNNVTLTGTVTGTYTTSSDERLKNINGAYTKGLNEVLQVNPVVFEYKGSTGRHVGVIAQDVQKIFPEAVVTMPDGHLAVSTDPIFFAMLNAMKEINITADAENQKQLELQKELDELKAEIETLSACKSDGFVNKIKCFFYDVKMFVKSLISTGHKNNNVAIQNNYDDSSLDCFTFVRNDASMSLRGAIGDVAIRKIKREVKYETI